MKLSPKWVTEFVAAGTDFSKLAEELTLAGVAVEQVSGDGDGTVYEMEITTNRPDAMNHYGVARECSALYDLPLKPLDVRVAGSTGGAPQFPVEIQDSEGCARYTSKILRGVKIAPSPSHVADRLALIGQRPINNVADASNYTLWEMGHPTHAFDLDTIRGGRIIVRRARSGEVLKTLDGVERKLAPSDLIIADSERPIALAGVMGGFDTMITERTKNVLIEAAWFDPVSVRKTSQRQGMHTDASHRFERGADFQATLTACELVAKRIEEWAGGAADGAMGDIIPRRLDSAPIVLRTAEVRRILGVEISSNELLRILRKLGFVATPDSETEHEFTVTIPSWRLDIEREIDLIEEIARLHGYDKFRNSLPAFTGGVVELPEADVEARLRRTLLALGYDEAISSTFVSEEDAKVFGHGSALELENPLNATAKAMRTSLVPGMLDMIAYNLNRGIENARLFEKGHVFLRSGEGAAELQHICMGATGNDGDLHAGSRRLSFFDLKGDVDELLRPFAFKKLVYEPAANGFLEAANCAQVLMDGEVVAEFGQLNAEISRSRKLKQPVFVAEIFADRLFAHSRRSVRYEPVPHFPEVSRDFSFVLDESATYQSIEKGIRDLSIVEVKTIEPVEIFRGGALGEGKYSMLLRIKMQSSERTLRDEEIATWSARIVDALEKLGGKQRA